MNECQAGVGLCGEEAECFNGLGTYLCRCRKGYEDHSPSKAGTLCIRTPRAGRGRSCSPAPSRGLLFSRCERRRVAAGASTRGSLLAWGPAPSADACSVWYYRSSGFRCPCQVWQGCVVSLESSSQPGIQPLQESQPPFPQSAAFSALGLQPGTCEPLSYKRSVAKRDL